jgi:hypothetical protein
MRKTVTALVASSLLFVSPAFAAGTPRSGANSPTVDNQSSCMAKARAEFNSTGGSQLFGDRTKGGFGEAQSEFVAYLESIGMGYGEWLQASEYSSRDNCPVGN